MTAATAGMDDAEAGRPKKPPAWLAQYGKPLIDSYNHGYDSVKKDA